MWVEGNARGTMKRTQNSKVVLRRVYMRTGTSPTEWFFADDPEKLTIK